MCVCRYHFSAIVLLMLTGLTPALATDVNVIGLFNGKAIISVNGGKQRMLSAGEKTAEGVKLIEATSESATLEIDGKKRTLALGQVMSSQFSPSAKASVSLTANIQGHFLTVGTINGATTHFMVDTGASSVSLSSAEAKRIGLSYLNGERGYSNTANGVAPLYKVVLNSVKVGDIVLNQVEGVVLEGDALQVTLLGMSFLKRLEMKRDGSAMTLVKQY